MTDEALDRLVDKDELSQMGQSLREQNHYQMDDDSIAKSYNQKVKNDTNYLAKGQNIYEDNPSRDDDTFNFKKEQEILYNLQLRVSYKHKSSQKSHKLASLDSETKHEQEEEEKGESLPVEYYDSDD